jgi:feruloyl-CoA synthase
VVIAGADRNELAALIIPTGPASDPQLRAKLTELLHSFAAQSTGSSNKIRRAIVLTEPPSMDAGEMTDKGSINQRAVLGNRAALVEELYAERPSDRVIVIGDKA